MKITPTQVVFSTPNKVIEVTALGKGMDKFVPNVVPRGRELYELDIENDTDLHVNVIV